MITGESRAGAAVGGHGQSDLDVVRKLLQLVLLGGMCGLLVELALLEHYEDVRQWIPLVSLSLSVLTLAAVLLRPVRGTVLALRAVMAALLVIALLGIYFHYTGNTEFELEMEPELAGRALFWKSITGATPALAPGTLVLLGLVGLISTFRHPALGRRPPG